MIFGINIKARLRNKAFWTTFIPGLVLLSQQVGLHVFPENYAAIMNTVLGILGLFGIIIDTSTPGIADMVPVPVQVEENKEEQ